MNRRNAMKLLLAPIMLGVLPSTVKAKEVKEYTQKCYIASTDLIRCAAKKMAHEVDKQILLMY